MNVVAPTRPGKSISGIAHRIVAYDRQTDEYAFQLPVPGFLDSLATKIAEVNTDDRDGIFCYPLEARQVDVFRFLLGLNTKLDKYEYFLEPIQLPEITSGSGRTVNAPSYAIGPEDRAQLPQPGRHKARAEAMATFDRLVARSRTRNRNSSRITKSELTVPTLRVLEDFKGEWVQRSVLIERLTELLTPSGIDAEITAGRNDAYFSQKVRNIIAHRHNEDS